MAYASLMNLAKLNKEISKDWKSEERLRVIGALVDVLRDTLPWSQIMLAYQREIMTRISSVAERSAQYLEESREHIFAE